MSRVYEQMCEEIIYINVGEILTVPSNSRMKT